MVRPSAAYRIAKEHTERWLFECGWGASDDGWRHPNLNGGRWGWPLLMAAQLQKEAYEGMRGLVYRLLRGEE